jgi:hypothetical protein
MTQTTAEPGLEYWLTGVAGLTAKQTRIVAEIVRDSDWLRSQKGSAWDEGFTRAWYAALPYDDSRDASESGIPNPYDG